MTMRATKALSVAVWAIGMVPAAVLMQWFGLVEWTWRGFFSAYAALLVVSLTYELFERWVERRLAARGGNANATPDR